jgi:F-box only protein C-terminal region
MACVYPGYEESEMRCKMRLRTRSPGLNNRLDISDLFTYDRTDGTRANLASTPLVSIPSPPSPEIA